MNYISKMFGRMFPNESMSYFQQMILKLGTEAVTEGVLKNFANFTGKHRCWSLSLKKLTAATLLKRVFNTGVF